MIPIGQQPWIIERLLDQAVQLLKDLKALGARKGTVDAFDQRVRRLRERHVKKVSLLERLTRAGL